VANAYSVKPFDLAQDRLRSVSRQKTAFLVIDPFGRAQGGQDFADFGRFYVDLCSLIC